MKQIPVDENNISKYNKKAIKFIIILVICGIDHQIDKQTDR